MRSWVAVTLQLLLAAVIFSSSFPCRTQGQTQSQTLRRKDAKEEVGHRRSLLSFKETKENATFECSPAGPCVACHYSEKNEEKYHCSETGYRIPLKCIETGDGSNEANDNKFQKRRSALENDFPFNSYIQPKVHAAFQVARKLNTSIRHLKWRRLLDTSFTSEDGKRSYIIYRSCVPVEDGEKLSVLHFEGIIVCLLLVSASFIYFWRKHTVMSGVGAVRIPTNSRF